MTPEIDRLLSSLENKYNQLDESDLKEWRSHPVTKAFSAHITKELIDSLLAIGQVPIDEHSRLLHAAQYGKRDFIQDLLDGDYLGGEHEEYKL